MDVSYAGYSVAGTLDFDVQLEVVCDSTTLSALTINDMTFTIFESSDTQVLPSLSDTVSDLKSDSTYCGDRVYSISQITPSIDYTDFLSLDTAT